MKYIFLLTIITTLSASAQVKLQTPCNNDLQKERIKNEKYEMVWYVETDTSKTELAQVTTEIIKQKNRLLVTTVVDMKKSNAKWIDSTVTTTSNLRPLRHASYNQQRDMVLDFGNTIIGYYLDKGRSLTVNIAETVDGGFFDSNLYPQIIRWLPLKENYTTAIAIFNYSQKSEVALLKATITGTKSGILNGKKVWVVNVTDDISANKVENAFYIDMVTNQLLRQEITTVRRRMVMELVTG